MSDQLRSIGLGTICMAAILSGAGDLRQYAHGRQLLRKAGLNLAESTSGKRKGQIVLSKRGDATLRKYLYLAMLQLVGNNPLFRQMHEVPACPRPEHRCLMSLLSEQQLYSMATKSCE
ncbi:transposase [Paenibacillus sp. Soil522]|uniref:transposase n=1 Tax=Paenibacillus sp. Soil522 TaxID=1736388 RepID=UPI002E15AD0C